MRPAGASHKIPAEDQARREDHLARIAHDGGVGNRAGQVQRPRASLNEAA